MNIEDILRKPESAGKPYFNVDIRILDQKGREVPSGEMGEIVSRGPNMMLGYWNQPEATRDAIKDGWLYTGDMGRFDEEGYLYVVDRVKDMILSGGENVYPAEVERIIREVPGVKDVAVVGIPHDKWGEVGKAFIEKKPGGTLRKDEVIQYCRSKLASYKVPKLIEYVDELPRNPSGKVLKKDLRTPR
jgi:acyl-CoA synthetase (AMP-forming)/AMP-acid ligase II